MTASAKSYFRALSGPKVKHEVMSNADFKKAIIPHLPELLEYQPDGSLLWLHRSRDWFATDISFSTWNGRYPGSLALNKIGNHGYRCGTICSVGFLSHRVVWAMHNGAWPDECDHENRVRTDNRIENLRDTDKVGNQRNASLRSDNTSGQVGVFFRKDSGRWGACIGSSSKLVHIGTFDKKEDAIAARKHAETVLGFDIGHGSSTATKL